MPLPSACLSECCGFFLSHLVGVFTRFIFGTERSNRERDAEAIHWRLLDAYDRLDRQLCAFG
jgi:hypothetical protein